MTGLPGYLTTGDQTRKTVLACAWVLREYRALDDADLLAEVVRCIVPGIGYDTENVEVALIACSDLIDAIELCSDDPATYAHSVGERPAIELAEWRELTLDVLRADLYATADNIGARMSAVAS